MRMWMKMTMNEWDSTAPLRGREKQEVANQNVCHLYRLNERCHSGSALIVSTSLYYIIRALLVVMVLFYLYHSFRRWLWTISKWPFSGSTRRWSCLMLILLLALGLYYYTAKWSAECVNDDASYKCRHVTFFFLPFPSKW